MTRIWSSQQGSERVKNHDGAFFYQTTEYLISMILDVSERTTVSHEFTEYWIETIFRSLRKLDRHPRPEQVIQILREEQKILRQRFMCELAAYCIVCACPETSRVWLLSCGDCRCGIKKACGDIQWQNKPNNFSEVIYNPVSDDRFTLTKSLNAKRFVVPDQLQFQLESGENIVLATDGFWADINTEYAGKDDASYLEFSLDVSEEAFENKQQGTFRCLLG